jgi:hypothetical protein
MTRRDDPRMKPQDNFPLLGARHAKFLTQVEILLAIAAFAALVVPGCTLQAGGAPARVAVLDQQFFSQCPLAVDAPSLSWVVDAPAWQKMVARARVSPLPFEVPVGQFNTRSLWVLATPTTARPSTQLSVAPDGLKLDGATQGLRMAVQVSNTSPPAGELSAAVLGQPCLLVWTSALPGVKSAQAHDAKTGALLAQHKLP